MVAGVLVSISNKNVDKIFDYNIPNHLLTSIRIGIRVLVPFANMQLEGIVLEIKNDTDTFYELKSIIDIVDETIVLNDELLELGKWMKNKTLSTLISCYQTMLPKALKVQNKNTISIKYDTYYIIFTIDCPYGQNAISEEIPTCTIKTEK